MRNPAEDVAQLAKMVEQNIEDEYFVNSVKELLPHLYALPKHNSGYGAR